jgi:hypothetical protein
MTVEILTEAELRMLWQNGNGSIPLLPVNTRLTPSAWDFVRANRIELAFGQLPPEKPQNYEEKATPYRFAPRPLRKKTIFTERDIETLAAQGVTGLQIDENTVITSAAMEKIRRLEWRLTKPDPDSQNPLPKTVQRMTLAPGKRTFYTEEDINIFFQQGIREINVSPQVKFTAAAHDRLHRLGIRCRNQTEETISQPVDLIEKIKSAVKARLPYPVTEAELDAVIHKIMAEMKSAH